MRWRRADEIQDLTRRNEWQAQVIASQSRQITEAKRSAEADAKEVDRLERELRQRDRVIEDQQHELRLARRHLDNCPTAVAVSEHTSDKRREDI